MSRSFFPWWEGASWSSPWPTVNVVTTLYIWPTICKMWRTDYILSKLLGWCFRSILISPVNDCNGIWLLWLNLVLIYLQTISHFTILSRYRWLYVFGCTRESIRRWNLNCSHSLFCTLSQTGQVIVIVWPHAFICSPFPECWQDAFITLPYYYCIFGINKNSFCFKSWCGRKIKLQFDIRSFEAAMVLW